MIKTVFLIYFVFVGLNNNLHKMHGTYIKMEHDCFNSHFNMRSGEKLRDTTLRAVVYSNPYV